LKYNEQGDILNLIIGPVLGNPETEIKLSFGCNVSAERVIDFVKRNAYVRETCGLISTHEASEMIKQTEEKLKNI
jgi:hypothetical protein